jgi:hypothetical protein
MDSEFKAGDRYFSVYHGELIILYKKTDAVTWLLESGGCISEERLKKGHFYLNKKIYKIIKIEDEKQLLSLKLKYSEDQLL